MKVNITIDCTPAEARATLGLPDLTMLHDAYLGRMKTVVEQGVTPELASDIVRSWTSMGGAGMGMMQQMLSAIAGGGKPGGTG